MKPKSALTLTGAVALLGLAPLIEAADPGGNPAGLNPATPKAETGRPADDVANAQDQLFLRQFSLGNRAEVELGRLAGQRGSAQAVKDFAAMMAADHNKALDKLRPVARGTNTPLPTELDRDHKVKADELQKLSGAAFDAEYLRSQIMDHQRTVQLLQWNLSFGQHSRVKALAKESLPQVLEHLRLAREAHAQVTGAAP